MYNGFYNPYMYNIAKPSIFSNLFKKFSLSGFLAGAGKTINVVNQAIPIYQQIKPMVSNAKTMLKVMSAIKGTNNNTSKKENNTNQVVIKKENSYSNGNPTFFL